MPPRNINPIEMLAKDYAQRGAVLMKMMGDLMKLHKTVLERIDYLEKTVAKQKGPKGDKPTQSELIELISPLIPQVTASHAAEIAIGRIREPKDGKTPSKEELMPIIKSLVPKVENGNTPVKGVDYMTEEDMDAISKRVKIKEITGEDILDMIEKLPAGKKIKTNHIDGLEQTVGAVYNQLKARGGYLHGGGVSSLSAGSGITLTKNGDGSYTITSTAGSATFVENEVVSGSGTSFTLANTPITGSVHVFGAGQRLKLTTNYSISGSTITTVDSWSDGDITADYRI